MNNKLLRCVILLSIAVFVFSAPLFAQEGKMDPTDKVKAEMEAMFGVYPSFMKAFPKHLQPAAWEMMKARGNPDAALPAKYSELVSLGVASQVPCDYCVYYHTEMAKMLGASDAEIREAVAAAADTRHWSTVLNGANLEYTAFKAEIDKMFAFIKAQNETSKTSKK